jgi:diaminopimelate decarboxylase
LPQLQEGDLLAVSTVGAYGAVQGSTYNTRPLAPEILVSGDRFEIIRPRANVEDMLDREHIPDWL